MLIENGADVNLRHSTSSKGMKYNSNWDIWSILTNHVSLYSSDGLNIVQIKQTPLHYAVQRGKIWFKQKKLWNDLENIAAQMKLPI